MAVEILKVVVAVNRFHTTSSRPPPCEPDISSLMIARKVKANVDTPSRRAYSRQTG